MNLTNLDTSFSEKIRQDILTAWQEGHGGHAKNVDLFLGDEGLVLFIPKALYQAEIELTRNTIKGSQVLEEYLRKLVYTVCKDQLPMIEKFTKQDVDEIIPLIDLREGWIIAFYQFKKKFP